MIGCVQEGQRQSVNAVVDRLVEGRVPCGCVGREVDVGGVRPLKKERLTGFGKSEVCLGTNEAEMAPTGRSLR